MKPVFINVPVQKIADWPSFHDVFQEALGFPEFYGRNMDAWIDCMSSIDSPEDGLTSVTVKSDQILVLRIDDPFGFRERCPEQFKALIECSAFVNFRRAEVGETPVLALLLSGRY